MILTWSMLVPVGQFLLALSFFPALGLDRRRRIAVLLGLGLLLVLSPFLVSAGARVPRFFVAVNALQLFAKLHDAHIGVVQGARPAWRGFLALLFNIFAIVQRKLDAAAPEPRREWRRLALRIAQAGAAALLIAALMRHDWTGVPWLWEHIAIVTAFSLAGVATLDVAATFWRLSGRAGYDFMPVAGLFARTPAEFWRNWNQPTQQFLYEDVFKPAGGWRAPARGLAMTFAISALAHEYLFVAALGRVQGYQTVFFLLQGLATAATLRLRPAGWTAWPWTAATLAFNLFSSVFFMASMHGLFRFYSRGTPAWLWDA